MQVAVRQKEKDGKVWNNYYLVLDNGTWIAIKPAYNNDYKALKLIAVADLPKKDKE